MQDKRGLDGRARDENGRIGAKNGATRIDTLRDTYGQTFAGGFRTDMKLDTLLGRTGCDSLSQFRRKSNR